MSWDDIVKYHLPDSKDEDIDSIYNWCYNSASSIEKTSNPKNSTILSCFQDLYLSNE